MTKEAMRELVHKQIVARTLTARTVSPKVLSIEKALAPLGDGSCRSAVAEAIGASIGEKIEPSSTGYRMGVAFKINPECKDQYPGGTMKGQVYVAIGDNVAKSRREGGREWVGLPKMGGTQHMVPTEDEIKGYTDNMSDDVLSFFLLALAD
jgi:hypothetical protein